MCWWYLLSKWKVTSFAKVTKSDVAVQILISNCFDSIKSRWTWKHPGPGKLHTLVPQTGHGSCGRQPGKTKMPLAGCRGFSANKWQCRGTGFLCSRATNRELQTLWRSSICLHGRRSCQCPICKVKGQAHNWWCQQKEYSAMAWRARKQQRREPQKMPWRQQLQFMRIRWKVLPGSQCKYRACRECLKEVWEAERTWSIVKASTARRSERNVWMDFAKRNRSFVCCRAADPSRRCCCCFCVGVVRFVAFLCC